MRSTNGKPGEHHRDNRRDQHDDTGQFGNLQIETHPGIPEQMANAIEHLIPETPAEAAHDKTTEWRFDQGDEIVIRFFAMGDRHQPPDQNNPAQHSGDAGQAVQDRGQRGNLEKQVIDLEMGA